MPPRVVPGRRGRDDMRDVGARERGRRVLGRLRGGARAEPVRAGRAGRRRHADVAGVRLLRRLDDVVRSGAAADRSGADGGPGPVPRGDGAGERGAGPELADVLRARGGALPARQAALRADGADAAAPVRPARQKGTGHGHRRGREHGRALRRAARARRVVARQGRGRRVRRRVGPGARRRRAGAAPRAERPGSQVISSNRCGMY